MEPEKIAALINSRRMKTSAYQLHQAVQRLKMELSHHDVAEFHFRDGSMDIVAHVTRDDFEGWIADELASIEGCVDGLLATTGIAPGQIDRVFLTGGTSFVPAVRRIFESRFTPARVRTGNEFTSSPRDSLSVPQKQSSPRPNFRHPNRSRISTSAQTPSS